MKNVRVKVVWLYCHGLYTIAICEGRKILFKLVGCNWSWTTEIAAIRNAKTTAKRIGIPYDPEIIKQHGC